MANSSKSLAQQVSRLNHEHQLVRRYAVASIFDLLAQHNTHSSKSGRDALQSCFQQSNKEVLEEAVQQLLGFVPKPGLSYQDATDLVVAAISAPGSDAVVPALVDGLYTLLRHLTTAGEVQLGAWQSHPLCRALTSQTQAQPSLLLGLQRLVHSLPHCKLPEERQQLTQQLVQPFLSFIMLSPDAAGRLLGLKAGLHAFLVRAVCNVPLLQPLLLPQLLLQLAVYKWNDPLQAGWLTSLVPDLVDAVQSTEGMPGDQAAQQLAHVLIQLSFDAQHSGLSLAPFLSGLRRLTADWPNIMQPHVTLLAYLTIAAGNSDAISFLQLLSDTLKDSSSENLALQQGLLMLPLVNTLALHPSQKLKAWAQHVLSNLQLPNLSTDSKSRPQLAQHGHKSQHAQQAQHESPKMAFHGVPTLLQQAVHQLEAMNRWCSSKQTQQPQQQAEQGKASIPKEHTVRSPMTWLAKLTTALQQPTAVSADSASDASNADCSQQNEVMKMILIAVLDHPEPCVQAAAADACSEVVQTFPIAGISFLPLLMYQLRRSVAHGREGEEAEKAQQAQVQLALLRAIPRMAMHQTALPFVQRALLPFSMPDVPEAVQAMALRMSTQLWQVTGRGWGGLLGGLTGFATAHPHATPLLRVARAACVRDVCRHDSSKGVELVRAIQECLGDSCAAVTALAIQSIALLCQDDVLEFYAAWRVVHAALPKLPPQDLVAAEWVSMLKHGVLDADIYPDKAILIIDMLWSVTTNSSAKVRTAAYEALAAYPLDLLETLEAQRPLHQYVDLLTKETDQGARAPCQGLVGRALAHEHMRRRRYIGSGKAVVPGASAVQLDPESLHFQLGQAVPKQLLHELHNTRHNITGTTLLLWGPPPPPNHATAASTATASEAAQAAASAYEQKFLQLLQVPSALGPTQFALLLHSWGRFLTRWLSAAKAAQGPAKGQQHGAVVTSKLKGADQIWRAVEAALGDSNTVAAENAAHAAGALCHVVPAACHALVSEIVQKLQSTTSSKSAGPARASLLALSTAAAHLHPTDHQTQHQVLHKLLEGLRAGHNASMRGASAEALGLFAAGTASSKTADSGDKSVSALNIWRELLNTLCVLCSAALQAAKKQLTEAAPAWLDAEHLQTVQQSKYDDEDGQIVLGIFLGLAHATPALATSAQQPSMLSWLQFIIRLGSQLPSMQFTNAATLPTQSSTPGGSEAKGQPNSRQSMSDLSSQHSTALAQGVCYAQAAACSCLKLGAGDEDAAVMSTLQQLHGVLHSSKQGKLTGAAASSLGLVLKTALHRLSAESAHQQPSPAETGSEQSNPQQSRVCGTLAQGYEATVKEALVKLCEASRQVIKLPSAAVAKQGVALGLATLLEASTVPTAKPEVGDPSLSWRDQAKHALKELYSMSFHDTDPRVAAVASWGLAAACHAQKHRPHSKGAPTGGPTWGPPGLAQADVETSKLSAQLKTLTGIPADGAMRALVEIVVQEVSMERSTDAPNLAAVLQCLADAPALPALDWSFICHSLFPPTTSGHDTSSNQVASNSQQQPATSDGHVSEVHTAVVLLALRHGSMVSHGFGGFLDQLFTGPRFSQLSLRLQQVLLTGLPEALQSLSTQRSIALLGTLCTLCFPPNQNSNSKSKPNGRSPQPYDSTRDICSVALWTGLARSLHSAKHAEQQSLSWPAAVIQAAHATVWELLPQLPPPPVLVPGEQLPNPSWDLNSALSSDTTKLEPQTQWVSQRNEVRLWGAACACLHLMPQAKVQSGLEAAQRGSDCVQAHAFATAMMVARQHVPLHALDPVRHSCTSQVIENLDAVMAAVGIATSSMSQSQQQSLLLETINAMQVSTAPEQALQLMAMLVAHWQSAVTSHALSVQMLTSSSLQQAVQCLPYTLFALVQQKAWHEASGKIVQRLTHLVSSSDPSEQYNSTLLQSVAACVLALRHRLPSDTWQHMPRILTISSGV